MYSNFDRKMFLEIPWGWNTAKFQNDSNEIWERK